MYEIVCLGDSFERGAGTHELPGGGWSDAIAGDSYLRPVCAPFAIINSLLDSGWGSSTFARFGGTLELSTINSLTAHPGLIITCEDAGDLPQPLDPDAVYSNWVNLLTAAKAKGQVLAQTTPDLNSPEWISRGYTATPPNSRFDLVATGSTTGIARTANDAIRAAAATVGVPVYDFATHALRIAKGCCGVNLIRVMWPDGIHNRLWMDIAMAAGRLRALGLLPVGGNQIARFVADKWSILGYETGQPGALYPISQAIATELLSRCLTIV